MNSIYMLVVGLYGMALGKFQIKKLTISKIFIFTCMYILNAY